MTAGRGNFGGGRGSGRGQGLGRGAGSGMGRMSGAGTGYGPQGNCVCSSCGTTVPHQPGVPCNTMICPKCGAKLGRNS